MEVTATKTTLENLDAQQRRAVEHSTGAMCVLGGPGTGKTTVLEERFVRLALQEGSSADRILFLVPNRAQKIALEDRITRRLLFDEGLEALGAVPVYTWHGLANHLVSRHYDLLGYTEPPVLLTSPEQWGDVRDELANENELNWAKQYRSLLKPQPNRGFVDEVVDFCIRAEQRVLEPADLERLVAMRPAWTDLVRFFTTHRQRLRQRSRIDYPTLLHDATELIANFDGVREGLHQRFTHILVDDAQELARVQQRLLRFLAAFTPAEGGPGERSLVVAADPDSSIETFRGAEPQWIDTFDDEFGPAERVVLPTSYRLGDGVGGPAHTFISVGSESEHRPLEFAGATELEVHRYQSLAAEVDAVARTLRLAHLEDGVAYKDMAILLTSPRQMLLPLERALGAVEVPYTISAPDRPLEREAAVRSFIQLARFATGRDQDDDSLRDVLRSPLVGLDTQHALEIDRAARAANLSLLEYILAPPEGVTHGEELTEMLELRELLRASVEQPADRAFWKVWDRATYYRKLEEAARRNLEHPANRDLDALVAFSRSLARFVERRRGTGTLKEFMGSISRADFGSDPWLPPERRRGGVEILSFHAAKGRQWDVVCVAGCVEGAIPKGRRAQGLFDPYFLDGLSESDRLRRNEAEDRRVFYVALTRAARRCIVSASPGPTRKGSPSRFVAEIAGAMPEIEARPESLPLTFSEAAARCRRVLADTNATAPERLAALATVERICRQDPGCSTARPGEWWWRWDWSEGAIPINAQRPESDDDLPPDKLRTSYSRISNYDNCGLQYLLSVVLGLDAETSHNMAFGTWLHQIFEDCEKEPTEEQKQSGRRRLRNRAAVFERYEELFDESVFPNRAIARQFKHDGEVMLSRFIEKLGPGEALLVEQSFAVDFQGHRITGRIDRVTRAGNGVLVSDYKTSRHPIRFDEVADSLQLAIYYLAAKADPEIAALGDPVGMQLVYPAKTYYDDVAVRSQKPEQAEKVLERLPELIEHVLEEDFRPSPEADCMWCKFKPLCPLWAQGQELPA
jgi:superfamily I DNA/RNA helicase